VGLPLTGEEQTLLLESLGLLVEAAGPAPLLAAPIEPTPAFFPDRYVPTADGARAVAERLLGYAALGSLHCVVEAADPRAIGRPGAAAWFTGIEGFRCFFGVDPAHLGDAEALVASLAHEVAHAFRRHHRLEGRGALDEERSTDATTVFLGFGVMTTIMTERVRTSGHFVGTRAYTYSSHARFGYLPPAAMAFLLAAQARARRAGWRERRRLAGLLETNQAAFFRVAHSALARREAELLRLLRLPHDRKPAPAPHPLRRVAPVTDVAPPPAARRTDNSGRRVFRVTGTRRLGAGLVGAVIAALPFWTWSATADRTWPLAPGAIGAAALAWRWGRRRPDRCSDAQCEAELPPRATVCPACGGAISGTLADANDRLDAEERLRRAEAPASRKMKSTSTSDNGPSGSSARRPDRS